MPRAFAICPAVGGLAVRRAVCGLCVGGYEERQRKASEGCRPCHRGARNVVACQGPKRGQPRQRSVDVSLVDLGRAWELWSLIVRGRVAVVWITCREGTVRPHVDNMQI